MFWIFSLLTQQRPLFFLFPFSQLFTHGAVSDSTGLQFFSRAGVAAARVATSFGVDFSSCSTSGFDISLKSAPNFVHGLLQFPDEVEFPLKSAIRFTFVLRGKMSQLLFNGFL